MAPNSGNPSDSRPSITASSVTVFFFFDCVRLMAWFESITVNKPERTLIANWDIFYWLTGLGPCASLMSRDMVDLGKAKSLNSRGIYAIIYNNVSHYSVIPIWSDIVVDSRQTRHPSVLRPVDVVRSLHSQSRIFISASHSISWKRGQPSSIYRSMRCNFRQFNSTFWTNNLRPNTTKNYSLTYEIGV